MAKWLVARWRWVLTVVGAVLTFITTSPQEILGGITDWQAVLALLPLPDSPVQLLGLLLLLVAVGPTLLGVLRGAWRRATGGEQPAPAQVTVADSALVRVALESFEISGLLKSNPNNEVLEFSLTLQNFCGFPLKMVGADGFVNIAGERQEALPVLMREGDTMPAHPAPHPVELRLNTPGLRGSLFARGTASAGTMIPLSLNNVALLCDAQMEDGVTQRLRLQVLDGNVILRGPLTHDDDFAHLARVTRTFGSARWWSSDGLIGPDDVPAPPPDQAASPPPPVTPPDEQIVILANGYALPAHKAARDLVNEVMNKCFDEAGDGTNEGRRAGLAARYFKDAKYRPGEALAVRVHEAISATPEKLIAALEELDEDYADLLAFVFHIATCGILPDPLLYKATREKNGALVARMTDLSKGIAREWIAQRLRFTSERREVFEHVATMLPMTDR